MENRFEDVQFPGWTAIRKLGEGSFGGVYEIHRTLPDGRVEKAALKKLTVPKDNAEVRDLYAQSFSKESITAHYKDQMRELVSEYSLMQELNDCRNVVACHDIQCVQHSDGVGWDIYIRMELLKPLKEALQPEYQEAVVLKLGRSLCNALLACRKHNIIHRDIKPENILVSPKGEFKLGDFGIAKISEKTATGTFTGTAGYMAPEVANRWHYGFSADIYSLGMVLYWMMNQRTLPFLPLPPEIPTAQQRQTAIDRRLSGEELPPPCNGSDRLWKIVRKACAFSADDRYKTPQEMYSDLMACSAKEKAAQSADMYMEATKQEFWEQDTVIEPKSTLPAPEAAQAERCATADNAGQPQNKVRIPKRTGIFAAACLLAVALLAGFLNIHFWTQGSCVEPVKCKLCGKIKSEAPGHQWVEATCTEARHCSVCGETSGEPLGHQWIEADCTSAKHCSVCGLVSGTPLGHQWVDATYDSPKHCTKCGLTEGTALTKPKPKLSTGSGTRADPYRLRTPEDLELLRNQPNAYYRLENDIDFANSVFTPIGEFGGVLDGHGYAIRGVTFKYVNGATGMAAALIVNVLKSGVVENLTLECEMRAEKQENTDGAGITVCNEGIIRNCNVKANIQNSYTAGGITRNNTVSGQIVNCNVTLTTNNCKFVGGIAEYQSGTLSNCSAEIQVTGATSIGGIAYANAGSIKECTAKGVGKLFENNGCLGGVVGENLEGGEIYTSTSTVETGTGERLPAVGSE